MPRGLIIVTSIALLATSGCATAPRSAAGRIADAGIKVTTTFQSNTSALADQLAAGGVTEAFVTRWQLCQNPNPGICKMPVPPDPGLAARRRALADAVRLRALALGALGMGYAALAQEADYDARGDMAAAANDAATAVNNFAGAVFALNGAPVPAAVAPLIGEAAGLIADRQQRHRILAANAKLRDITLRLRDSLQQEQAVFDTIAGVTAQRRQEVMIALFQAGLIPGDQLIRPMTDSLGIALGPDAAATIMASPQLQAAVLDAARAQTELEIAKNPRPLRRVDRRVDRARQRARQAGGAARYDFARRGRPAARRDRREPGQANSGAGEIGWHRPGTSA
jgi:hypothetical protein